MHLYGHEMILVPFSPINEMNKNKSSEYFMQVSLSESSSVRVRLLWDTLTPDTDQWPPLYILWRIHSKSNPQSIC